MDAKEILQKIKSSENNEESLDMMIFLTNPKELDLMQGIMVWKHSEIKFDSSKYENTGDDWSDIWKCCDFDVSKISFLLKKNNTEAMMLIKRLIALKLIYPDGEVNKIAFSLSRKYITSKIGKLKGS